MTTTGIRRPEHPRPVAGRAIAFEWVKARSVSSMRRAVLATLLITPAIAVFVGATRSLQDDDTVLGGSLTGSTLAMLVASVTGALGTANEWSTGTARVTFAAIPQRSAVLAAKAVVAAAVTFAAGVIGAVLALGFGHALLPDGRYADGSAFPALLGVGAVFAVAAVFGVAVGAIVRGPAGAVGAAIGFLLVPSLLAPLLGPAERWVAGSTPTGVLQKFTQTSDATAATVGSLGPWPSLVAVAAGAVALLALAAWTLERRDV